jgi:hypothetical protein
MHRGRIERAALIAIVSLLLAGCIPMPVPWSEDPAHHLDNIEWLQIGTTTRDGAVKILGEPLITGEGGRYSVYRWWEDRGKMVFVWLAPMGPYDQGPLYQKQYVLFLDFDAGGVLSKRELGSRVAGKGRGMDDSWYAYCTAEGLCLRNSEEYSLTASPTAARQLPIPLRADGGCPLHVWPAAKDWDQTDGLSIALAEPPAIEHVWLPPGTFIVMAVPPGAGTLRARSPQLNLETSDVPADVPGSARYRCEASAPIYLEIGTVNQSGGRATAMNVYSIDAATAATRIAGMNRVLLP